MAGRIEARLAELGLALPEPASPAANYVPYLVARGLVFVSAQGPIWNGEPRYLGRIGAELSLEQGRAAAELTALNLVAQIKRACAGDLDRVRRIVRLGGFINATPTFSQLPQVMDGASDLMVRIFDGAGRHARFVLGAAALPLGLAVAIDAVADVGGR